MKQKFTTQQAKVKWMNFRMNAGFSIVKHVNNSGKEGKQTSTLVSITVANLFLAVK